MDLLLDLADPGATELSAVGGKGANLGAMLAAGLPVPGGFCVTTAGYRLSVGTRLDDLFDALAQARPQELAGLAAEARDRVRGAEPPAELRDLLAGHYATLGEDVPVAVRSSATAEDLATASFAGQQDTYLNVVGPDAVLDAVRRCWASLWNDRAVSYRNANGVDHRQVTLAVVVQRMVEAVAAGVMFTANPVTGTRHETVIDAAPGLGEAVVSGAVNPDHFVLDRPTGRISARLGDKRTVITARPGGGTDRAEQADGSDRACLTDEQVRELGELGERAARHYAAPQDTEWALDADGRFWLTQARPVTTLYPVPDTDRTDTRIFLCLTLAQGLTRPITPMGLAAFRLIGSSIGAAAGAPPLDRVRGPRAISTPGQRLYVDITPVLRVPLSRRLAIGVAGAMEARTGTVLRRLASDPRFAFTGRSPLPVIRPVARVALVRARVPARLLTALVSPAAARRAMTGIERRVRRSLTLPANSSAEERLDHVERGLGHDLFLIMPTVFAYPACGLLLLALARKLLGDRAGPGEVHTVLRSLPHNVTTEMDLQLWRVSRRIRDDAESAGAFAELPTAVLTARYRARTLPPVAQQAVTGFLRRYGHRAVAEIDLGMPRWSDDPDHILGVLANYLRLGDDAPAPDVQFAEGAVAAEAKLAELAARVPGRVRSRLTAFALRRSRELVGLRESPKFLLIVALGHFRRQLALVGETIAQRGGLDHAEDVFFLDLEDARRGLAGERLQYLVAERRTSYGIESQRRRIPRLLMSDGTEPEAVGSPREGGQVPGSLSGSPASPGTVTARARVVLDPVAARLEPGEILVAPSTDPGWTPLFLTAGGLVMEMGGSNSHGAVVAREYGIPAVVGVPEATHRIRTGQLVTLDGAAGLVRIDGTPAPEGTGRSDVPADTRG